MKFLYLILGGSLGTILRYSIYLLYSKRALSGFPYGSLTVNLIGSLLIGLTYGLLSKSGISSPLRLFLFVGFFGSFTTFSTFSMDNIQLIQEGNIRAAIIYFLSSNILGIGLCAIGLITGQYLINK
ncbi:MAG: fluoride efflux transporter CrcB [Hyphomicrobiales bacterium]